MIRAGIISARDADEINEAIRFVRGLKNITAIPPLYRLPGTDGQVIFKIDTSQFVRIGNESGSGTGSGGSGQNDDTLGCTGQVYSVVRSDTYAVGTNLYRKTWLETLEYDTYGCLILTRSAESAPVKIGCVECPPPCSEGCTAFTDLIGSSYNEALDGVENEIEIHLPLDCSAGATAAPNFLPWLFVPVSKNTTVRLTYSDFHGWIRRISDDTIVANYTSTATNTPSQTGNNLTCNPFSTDPAGGLSNTPLNAFTPYSNAAGELVDNPGGVPSSPGWLAGLPEATTVGLGATANPEEIDRSGFNDCSVFVAGITNLAVGGPDAVCDSNAYYVDLRFKIKFEELP